MPALVISEVISSNDAFLPVDGEYYDLIEVHNTSSQPLDLSGYFLTDKRGEPSRYAFPAVTLEAGGCYVVYASGEPSLGPARTSFRISSSGETVYLVKDGLVTDLMTVPGDLKRNESYGRSEGVNLYFSEPSPGEVNGAGYLSGVAAPAADCPSGIYSQPLTLMLTASGTVYYTLDGSRPTTESTVYTQPILIDKNTTLRKESGPALNGYIPIFSVRSMIFPSFRWRFPGIFSRGRRGF